MCEQKLHTYDIRPIILDHRALSHSSAVVAQSKASCMPAKALQPKPGWTVLDCCAAPGNKTTHVAGEARFPDYLKF